MPKAKTAYKEFNLLEQPLLSGMKSCWLKWRIQDENIHDSIFCLW
jgi:hypothetical protein